MKPQKILLILLIFPANIFAQHSDIENKYQFLHSFIIENKVKSITECHTYNYGSNAPCSADSEKIFMHKQVFDEKGRLIMNYDSYHDSIPGRLISYQFDNSDKYTGRTFIIFDPKGNIKRSIPWKFNYDSLGRRIKAVIDFGNGDRWDYSFAYDENNNLITEYGSRSIGDYNNISTTKWIFHYDKKNRLIKRNEYDITEGVEKMLIGPTEFIYNNKNLISKEITRKAPDTTVAFIDKAFFYDKHKRLVSITEKKKVCWKCSNNRTFNYQYEYNDKGILLNMRKYIEGKEYPVECYKYIFEFY